MGGGAYFVAWNNSPSRKDFMNGHLQTVPSLMITFALRGDFTYFFNDKLGLQFSHAHGFGLLTHAVAMDRRMYPQDLTHYYSFMLKLDKVYNELNRIGINLNQSVRKINTKSTKDIVLKFEDEVIKCCEEIAEVLEDLGGIDNAISYENSRRKENE